MTNPSKIEAGDTAELERRIGYHFQDGALLRTALTHSSFRGAESDEAVADNERLEFLGDAILDWLVSESLYKLFPEAKEGALSRARSSLVRAENFFAVGSHLDLGRYLLLGPGEEKTGGRGKLALLGNALEALVAAIYLDGGVGAARRFVDEHILDGVEARGLEAFALPDSKTRLQEMLQARRLSNPRYTLASSSGPAHEKIFLVELWLDGRMLAKGRGSSKKAAEQEAAAAAIEEFTEFATDSHGSEDRDDPRGSHAEG